MEHPDRLFLDFQSALAGRYSLEREVGRGGMGVVYLAREVRLDRPVAIKLLPPSKTADPKLRERFLREARTAAKLSHPNVISIHAVEETGGFVFFAMAYVEGETLTERVRRRGPLPPSEAARILRDVAWALAYAHGQGVVHRDVKPDNILIEQGSGRVLVADFGIAGVVAGAGALVAGEVVGTPEFMSPEQALGEAVDARSDLFARRGRVLRPLRDLAVRGGEGDRCVGEAGDRGGSAARVGRPRRAATARAGDRRLPREGSRRSSRRHRDARRATQSRVGAAA